MLTSCICSLRPCRITHTSDGYVVLSSEAGVLPNTSPASVTQRTRLRPGETFAIDTCQAGRVLDDREIKATMASRYPYADWLARNSPTLSLLLPKVCYYVQNNMLFMLSFRCLFQRLFPILLIFLFLLLSYAIRAVRRRK